jgi:hypothetical protein
MTAMTAFDTLIDNWFEVNAMSAMETEMAFQTRMVGDYNTLLTDMDTGNDPAQIDNLMLTVMPYPS